MRLTKLRAAGPVKWVNLLTLPRTPSCLGENVSPIWASPDGVDRLNEGRVGRGGWDEAVRRGAGRPVAAPGNFRAVDPTGTTLGPPWHTSAADYFE